ncbi:MAG TPA: hypothetical protein V6D47_13835, partial [Oscillatoriaceae cyanobacterium]
ESICRSLADERGRLRAYELGSGWTEALARGTAVGTIAHDLALACRMACGDARRPVLVVPRRYRPLLAGALRPLWPELAVLAQEELSPRYPLHAAGVVAVPVS